jgi:hypothetical protein
MKKLHSIALVTSLGLSLAIAPSAQAKAKVTKPSAPTIVSISASTPKKGKVNVTVTIALPTSNGGSKITGSKVTAGGKSCTIKKMKTSCTIKGIKNGKSLKVIAKSKNKKGFGGKSVAVPFVVGSGNWIASPTTSPATTPARLICTLIGTTGNDVLFGTEGNDVICGKGGSDTINGLGGNDTIYAGNDPDSLKTIRSFRASSFDGINIRSVGVDSGSDIINGGEGNDKIYGSDGNDTITGDSGNDTVSGGSGDDNIDGSDGDDVLIGDSGNDTIDGGQGTNKCSGGKNWWLEANVLNKDTCGDMNSPHVQSISAPSLVDTSSAYVDVEVNISAIDDLSGISCIFVVLIGPNNQMIQNGCATRVSGDSMSGQFLATLRLPRYSQMGNWRIDVEKDDYSGIQEWSQGLRNVNQAGAGDTSPPTYSNLTFPNSLNTFSSSQVVSIEFDGSDNLSGIDCMFVTLSGPSNQMIQNGCATLQSGNNLSGRYLMQLTLPRYAQSGQWSIDIQPSDNASNHSSHQKIGFVTQAGQGDTDNPTYSNLSHPTSVSVASSSQVVSIEFDGSDNLSGIDCMFVTLSGPSNQLIQNGCATLQSGNNLSGRYLMQLTLPRYAQSGKWSIDIQPSDNAGNHPSHQGIGFVNVTQ